MKSMRFAGLAATGLILGFGLTGTNEAPTTSASIPADAELIKLAAKASAVATKALTERKIDEAVTAAELAVSYQPRDPALRSLLGRAYVAAGRFTSAETSFSDALTLAPNDARTGLNLALAEIAQGKRDRALETLRDFRDRLSPSDLGLALALAGNVDGGVAVLEAGIRNGENTPKIRQNLALAYAMQGQWGSARIMAMQDLSAEAATDRMRQWTNFVRPSTSYDQVASILGVRPATDAGQPTRLALNGTAAPAQAVVVNVDSAPSPQAMDGQVVDAQAPVAVAQAPVFETAPVVKGSTEVPVVAASTQPIKQMIVPVAEAKPVLAATQTLVQAQRFEAGKFVVQLGAFRSAKFSRDAWGRLSSRYSLTAYEPGNAWAKVRGANLIRLTVGSFNSRADAVGICTQIQKQGGSCFVRPRASDQLASWAPKAKASPTLARIAKAKANKSQKRYAWRGKAKAKAPTLAMR